MQDIGNGQTAGEPAKSKISRRTIVAGAAWATPVVMLASASPALAASNPGGVACGQDNKFYQTEGGGKFFNGSLFGQNLDTLADVKGIKVANVPVGGTPGVTVDPQSAFSNPVVVPGRPEGDTTVDAFSNPLAVSVLKGINVDLGGTTSSLGSILNLAETGAYSQYGYARENGQSRGFSGLVANSGGVTLTDVSAGPGFGNINLKTIISRLGGAQLAGLVNQLAALNLNIGAVGGDATLDACNNTADRKYLIAGADLTVGSDLLVDALDPVVKDGGLVDLVGSAVTGLTAPGGLLTGLVSSIVSKLNGLSVALAGNGLVVRSAVGGTQPTLSINLDPVKKLLRDPVVSGALTMSMTNPDKLVYVDLDALAGSLNGHNPNTRVLPANATVIDPLVTDITTFLNQLPQKVSAALWDAINAVEVHLSVSAEVWLTVLGSPTAKALDLKVKLDTTLADLISGNAAFTTETSVLGITLLDQLLDLVLSTLKPLLAPVGASVKTLLTTAVNNVGTALDAPVKAVASLLDGLLRPLLGGGGSQRLLNLTVNRQVGAYDVAALELGVLPDGGGINVTLAKAWAGPNTAVA